MNIKKRLSLIFSVFLSLSIFLISNLSFATVKKYDVTAIGSAMVDLIQYTSEEELQKLMPEGFKKADSTKIDEETANKIQSKMHNMIIIPGGSEANIIANIGSLGGKAAFNAIAAEDELGILFKKSLLKENVDFLSPFTKDKSLRTARCFTFITPDKDRTFAVSDSIVKSTDDNFINYDAIQNSKIFFTDSSNLSKQGNQNRITKKAINLAKKSHTEVAFNLSNNYYIETYRNEIMELLPSIDIIFGSYREAANLFRTDNLDSTITKYLQYVKIAVITLGKEGAVIATKEKRIHIPSEITDPKKIIDLNGAGDGFTAGFLYGYTHDYDLYKSGILASKTAAEIILQTGARPTKNLKQAVLNN